MPRTVDGGRAPGDGYVYPKRAWLYRRDPMNREETKRLEDACHPGPERVAIWTMLDTGLRVAELCGLKREQIDFQLDRISLVGKGRKRRVVPVPTRTRELLAHWFAVHESMPYRPRKLQRLIKQIAQRAGITRIKVTPHVCRHTFAVRSLQSGVSLASLQRVLGHASLMQTAIYLNISPEEALREFEAKCK